MRNSYTILETILPVSTILRLSELIVRRQFCAGRRTVSSLIMSDMDTTWMLYQSALTTAALGQRVLVVLGGGGWSRLPPTVHTMPQPSADIMANISFLYPNNVAELIKYLGLLGGGEKLLPEVVLLGNVEKLTGDGAQTAIMAKISAVLSQFLEQCEDRSDGRHPCRLIATAEVNQQVRRLWEKRMHLWYPEVWLS